MAIDNENKRRSVIGIFPVPDGSINAGDRRHTAGFYRGLAGIPSDIYPIDVTLTEQDIYGVNMDEKLIYEIMISESKFKEVVLSESKIYNLSQSTGNIYKIKLIETDISGDPLT